MMPILCRVRGPVGAPRAGAAPARPRGHPSVSHPLPVPSLSSTLPRAPQTLVDLFFIFLMSFVRCNCHAIKFTILICPLVCARLGSCAVISSTHLRTCHPPGGLLERLTPREDSSCPLSGAPASVASA